MKSVVIQHVRSHVKEDVRTTEDKHEVLVFFVRPGKDYRDGRPVMDD